MTDENKMNKGSGQQEKMESDSSETTGNIATATETEKKVEAGKKEGQQKAGESQEKSS